jgi:RNA polymerase sigma factor for flagellar operon FliA
MVIKKYSSGGLMDSEEKKLWELYKRTNRAELQEKIVIQYLNLVHYLAHRLDSFSSPTLDREDLYSAGVIGLLEAIERFDLEKNVDFKNYAMLRIRGAMIDELRRFDWVPRSVRKKSKILDGTIHKLFNELSRMPSDEEIAKEMEISVEEYYNLTDRLGPLFLFSLDNNFDSDRSENNLSQSITDDYNATLEETKEQLKNEMIEVIQSLPEKEKLVISLYYYENLNLKEIGSVIGVSESRVSQIHTSAINKLRTMLKR